MAKSPSTNGANGRDARGQFAQDNKGGPGNPHADPAEHQGQVEETTAKPAAASLDSLADALLTLLPADRERLAAMLKGDNA